MTPIGQLTDEKTLIPGSTKTFIKILHKSSNQHPAQNYHNYVNLKTFKIQGKANLWLVHIGKILIKIKIRNFKKILSKKYSKKNA